MLLKNDLDSFESKSFGFTCYRAGESDFPSRGVAIDDGFQFTFARSESSRITKNPEIGTKLADRDYFTVDVQIQLYVC